MAKRIRSVLVDVFNWVQVTSQRPDLFTRGIYRHAYQLALEFTPAYYMTPEEAAHVTPAFEAAHKTLELLIKKPILRFTRVQDIETTAKIWLSIGMDNVSPVLPLLPSSVLRCSVLHDVMSYRKVFGPVCERNFLFGAQYHDLLLPVSKFALKEYRDLCHQGIPSTQATIEYGCFHSSENFKPMNNPHSYSSYSVGTIEPRKRVNANAYTAWGIGFQVHHHIGAMEESEDLEQFKHMQASGKLRWHRALNDRDKEIVSKNCLAFFCLSSDEGFSMTPMEAILGGVQFVFLSDIPVHREIYGRYSVNFLRIGEIPALRDMNTYKRVTEEDRTDLFNRYKWPTVIAPFLKFAGQLI